jgi:hypothetical protein
MTTSIETLMMENAELREQIEGDDGLKRCIEDLKEEISHLEENALLESDINDWLETNIDPFDIIRSVKAFMLR